jgi:N-acyl-D-aspartate/D-glutamate deacylase
LKPILDAACGSKMFWFDVEINDGRVTAVAKDKKKTA